MEDDDDEKEPADSLRSRPGGDPDNDPDDSSSGSGGDDDGGGGGGGDDGDGDGSDDGEDGGGGRRPGNLPAAMRRKAAAASESIQRFYRTLAMFHEEIANNHDVLSVPDRREITAIASGLLPAAISLGGTDAVRYALCQNVYIFIAVLNNTTVAAVARRFDSEFVLREQAVVARRLLSVARRILNPFEEAEVSIIPESDEQLDRDITDDPNRAIAFIFERIAENGLSYRNSTHREHLQQILYISSKYGAMVRRRAAQDSWDESLKKSLWRAAASTKLPVFKKGLDAYSAEAVERFDIPDGDDLVHLRDAIIADVQAEIDRLVAASRDRGARDGDTREVEEKVDELEKLRAEGQTQEERDAAAMTRIMDLANAAHVFGPSRMLLARVPRAHKATVGALAAYVIEEATKARETVRARPGPQMQVAAREAQIASVKFALRTYEEARDQAKLAAKSTSLVVAELVRDANRVLPSDKKLEARALVRENLQRACQAIQARLAPPAPPPPALANEVRRVRDAVREYQERLADNEATRSAEDADVKGLIKLVRGARLVLYDTNGRAGLSPDVKLPVYTSQFRSRYWQNPAEFARQLRAHVDRVVAAPAVDQATLQAARDAVASYRATASERSLSNDRALLLMKDLHGEVKGRRFGRDRVPPKFDDFLAAAKARPDATGFAAVCRYVKDLAAAVPRPAALPAGAGPDLVRLSADIAEREAQDATKAVVDAKEVARLQRKIARADATTDGATRDLREKLVSIRSKFTDGMLRLLDQAFRDVNLAECDGLGLRKFAEHAAQKFKEHAPVSADDVAALVAPLEKLFRRRKKKDSLSAPGYDVAKNKYVRMFAEWESTGSIERVLDRARQEARRQMALAEVQLAAQLLTQSQLAELEAIDDPVKKLSKLVAHIDDAKALLEDEGARVNKAVDAVKKQYPQVRDLKAALESLSRVKTFPPAYADFVLDNSAKYEQSVQDQAAFSQAFVPVNVVAGSPLAGLLARTGGRLYITPSMVKQFASHLKSKLRSMSSAEAVQKAIEDVPVRLDEWRATRADRSAWQDETRAFLPALRTALYVCLQRRALVRSILPFVAEGTWKNNYLRNERLPVAGGGGGDPDDSGGDGSDDDDMNGGGGGGPPSGGDGDPPDDFKIERDVLNASAGFFRRVLRFLKKDSAAKSQGLEQTFRHLSDISQRLDEMMLQRYKDGAQRARESAASYMVHSATGTLDRCLSVLWQDQSEGFDDRRRALLEALQDDDASPPVSAAVGQLMNDSADADFSALGMRYSPAAIAVMAGQVKLMADAVKSRAKSHSDSAKLVMDAVDSVQRIRSDLDAQTRRAREVLFAQRGFGPLLDQLRTSSTRLQGIVQEGRGRLFANSGLAAEMGDLFAALEEVGRRAAARFENPDDQVEEVLEAARELRRNVDGVRRAAGEVVKSGDRVLGNARETRRTITETQAGLADLVSGRAGGFQDLYNRYVRAGADLNAETDAFREQLAVALHRVSQLHLLVPAGDRGDFVPAPLDPEVLNGAVALIPSYAGTAEAMQVAVGQHRNAARAVADFLLGLNADPRDWYDVDRQAPRSWDDTKTARLKRMVRSMAGIVDVAQRNAANAASEAAKLAGALNEARDACRNVDTAQIDALTAQYQATTAELYGELLTVQNEFYDLEQRVVDNWARVRPVGLVGDVGQNGVAVNQVELIRRDGTLAHDFAGQQPGSAQFRAELLANERGLRGIENYAKAVLRLVSDALKREQLPVNEMNEQRLRVVEIEGLIGSAVDGIASAVIADPILAAQDTAAKALAATRLAVDFLQATGVERDAWAKVAVELDTYIGSLARKLFDYGRTFARISAVQHQFLTVVDQCVANEDLADQRAFLNGVRASLRSYLGRAEELVITNVDPASYLPDRGTLTAAIIQLDAAIHSSPLAPPARRPPAERTPVGDWLARLRADSNAPSVFETWASASYQGRIATIRAATDLQRALQNLDPRVFARAPDADRVQMVAGVPNTLRLNATAEAAASERKREFAVILARSAETEARLQEKNEAARVAAERATEYAKGLSVAAKEWETIARDLYKELVSLVGGSAMDLEATRVAADFIRETGLTSFIFAPGAAAQPAGVGGRQLDVIYGAVARDLLARPVPRAEKDIDAQRKNLPRPMLAMFPELRDMGRPSEEYLKQMDGLAGRIVGLLARFSVASGVLKVPDTVVERRDAKAVSAAIVGHAAESTRQLRAFIDGERASRQELVGGLQRTEAEVGRLLKSADARVRTYMNDHIRAAWAALRITQPLAAVVGGEGAAKVDTLVRSFDSVFGDTIFSVPDPASSKYESLFATFRDAALLYKKQINTIVAGEEEQHNHPLNVLLRFFHLVAGIAALRLADVADQTKLEMAIFGQASDKATIVLAEMAPGREAPEDEDGKPGGATSSQLLRTDAIMAQIKMRTAKAEQEQAVANGNTVYESPARAVDLLSYFATELGHGAMVASLHYIESIADGPFAGAWLVSLCGSRTVAPAFASLVALNATCAQYRARSRLGVPQGLSKDVNARLATVQRHFRSLRVRPLFRNGEDQLRLLRNGQDAFAPG